jgi:hypothetical protein
MAASTGFIQSESAWLLRPGGGARKKMKGVMLLYPDKLAGVPVMAEYWGAFLGAMIAAFGYPADDAVWGVVLFAGLWLGGLAGRAIDRKLAVRAVATDPGNVTIIPLDVVTALRTERFKGLGGRFGYENVVVTTADGTEYGFRGRIGYLQADIASALSRAGYQVRTTPRGLAVTPHPASDGA